METYYAAERMNRAIDMVLKGLRDLRAPQLKPFYAQPENIPGTYAARNYDAVSTPMEDADLVPPTQQAFASQLTPQGYQVFVDFMASMGVLLQDDGTDIIVTEETDPFPSLGDVTSFLGRVRDAGMTLNTEFVNSIAAIMGVPVPSSTRKHITLSTPKAYAELDPIVARRMARMREYVRAYFY